MQDTGWEYICCLLVSQASHADCTWDGTLIFLHSHCILPFGTTIPSVIQAKHLHHPWSFPSPLDLSHSQQQGVWILCPKYILNPLPSLHLHWQTASTAVQTTTISYLDLFSSLITLSPPKFLHPSLATAHCCKNNHNYFTFLLNHFSQFPNSLLWPAWSCPCPVLQFHFMPFSLHYLYSSNWYCFTFF